MSHNKVFNIFAEQNILFETGRNQHFKNVLFLSNEDKEYIRELGKGMFEGFDENTLNKLNSFKKKSYLCQSLSKESGFRLEEHRHIYFESKTMLECGTTGKLVFGTVNEDTFHAGQQNVYTTPLRHDNVFMYFPVLYEWTQFFFPRMENETFEARELVKSISIPVKRFKIKENIIFKSFGHDMVESYKEKMV
jgi:hypothetical protein